VSLHTRKQVKTLVNELAIGSTAPKTSADMYHNMYRSTLKRIDDQPTSDRVLARKALMWISNAARLLKAQELCFALSIEPDDTEFDADSLIDVDLIVSVCAGLLIVEHEREIVRLVNYTAQEYFDSFGHNQRVKEQKQLATTCLTYLCFDNFKPKTQPRPTSATDEEETELFKMGPDWLLHHGADYSSTWGCDSYDSIRSREVQSVQLAQSPEDGGQEVEHAFVDYAANFWALHAQECQSDISQSALRLLTNQQLAAHAFRKATVLHRRWAFLRTRVDLASSRVTGLHLVAANGLIHVCREILRMLDAETKVHADAKDDGGRTALMWAAHHGHVEVVELLLLHYDVRHYRTDNRGDTALNYAVGQGKTAVVRLLIKEDSIRGPDNQAYTFFCARRQTERSEPEWWIRRENAFGETAIVQAVLEGHDEAFKLLKGYNEYIFQSWWDLGITGSLHHEVMFGLWPIHIAAQRRPVRVMELLIEDCGVETDVEDPRGYSTFVVAADWNNEDVVRYFLHDKRALLESRPDMVLKAAKVAAANWKREAILKLIVEEAGLMIGNVELDEILEAAVSAGNVNIAIFLATRKAVYERNMKANDARSEDMVNSEF
jgi:ankyrin repeat protein